MEIRRVQPDEGVQLRALRLRALADAPQAFGSTLAETRARPEGYWHRRIETASAGAQQSIFLAIEDGHWLGMAGGVFEEEQPDRAELISMWVDPSVRRRGLGRELIETVARWAQEHDAARLDLWVTSTNEAAVTLYTRLGWEPTGAQQPVPSHPWLSEIEMRKSLG